MYIHFDNETLVWNLYDKHDRLIGSYDSERAAENARTDHKNFLETVEYATGSRVFSGF